LDGVGDYLEAGPAFALSGGPFVEVEPADHGHLAALGQVFAAGGGQLVEGDDVDEVGRVGAGGDGEGFWGPRRNLRFRWG
jgi:hypothetical protein